MNAAVTLSSLVGPMSIGIVLTAAAIDLQRRRIPNWLTFGAWLLALPVQCAIHGLGHGSLAWAAGWLTGFLMFLPLYLLRGMAAGDVKLMAAVGAWLGAAMVLEVGLATFLIGGIWAMVVTLRHGRFVRLCRNLGSIVLTLGQVSREAEPPSRSVDASWSVGSLPYGVAIAAGTIAILFASAYQAGA